MTRLRDWLGGNLAAVAALFFLVALFKATSTQLVNPTT